MNSNLKLLPAALFVAVLALAGCGGGSSDNTPPPPATPQEMCEDAGKNWYEGACYTDQELVDLGAEQEGMKRDDEADDAERMANAEKFHGLLSNAGAATAGQPVNLRIGTYTTEIGNAEDGAYNQGTIQLMIGNTMGPATPAETHDGTNRNAANAIVIAAPRHVSGSGFATGQNELKTHGVNEGVPGSFMGASGTYTCTVAACNSRRTANGIQLGSATTGEWSFEPFDSAMYMIPDDDYARYGWWVDETAGLGTPRVGAWYSSDDADGSALALTGGVANSSGTASYTGTAIGVAAYHHSLGGDANAGGAFTAEAALSANFDTNMLSGSITNFDVGGHNPDWSVALGSSSIDPSNGAVVAGTGTTTWTIGGTAGTARDNTADGGWSAQFYDIPASMHQPTGVAGGFRARYDSDGYMVGSFGAEQ